MVFKINKKISVFSLLVVGCCSLFAAEHVKDKSNVVTTTEFFQKFVNLKGKEREEETKNINKKLQEYMLTLLILKKTYFKDYNISSLIQKSIKGLINNELDPHSRFFTHEEYKKFMESTNGNYVGVGVIITKDKKKNLIKILKVFKNGPAYKAGLKKNDLIVKVNDKIAPTSLEEIVEKIKGKEGTKVKITVYRPDNDKYLTVTLTRKKIKVPTFKIKIIDNDIGYLKISEFNKIELEEIDKKLKELKKKHIKGLIIDLRDNPGGLLKGAIKTVNMFINKGRILSIKGRVKEENKEFHADKNNTVFPNIPLVILVNNNTASAAEIVSGALKFYNRAIIIGTKTFGKGSVQSFVPLLSSQKDKNYDVAKITIARYYLPNGKSIQGEGIQPNIVIKEGEINISNKNENIFNENSLKNSNLLNVSKEKLLKEEKINYNEKEFYKDLQLYTAIQVIKGLISVKNK